MSQLPEGVKIRLATVDDADTITRLRWLLLQATGRDEDTATRSTYGLNYSDWLRKKIAQGEYIAWLSETVQPEVVAMVCLWLIEWQPTLTTPALVQAYVLNVYTADAYRGQGLGRTMMEMLLDECRKRGIRKISLHASDYGRPLYETLGFKSTNEMRLEL